MLHVVGDTDRPGTEVYQDGTSTDGKGSGVDEIGVVLTRD